MSCYCGNSCELLQQNKGILWISAHRPWTLQSESCLSVVASENSVATVEELPIHSRQANSLQSLPWEQHRMITGLVKAVVKEPEWPQCGSRASVWGNLETCVLSFAGEMKSEVLPECGWKTETSPAETQHLWKRGHDPTPTSDLVAMN